MSKKIRIVVPVSKKIEPQEETKSIKINIPLSQYNNLVENAKAMELKPEQLVMIAANKTDIFDKQVAPHTPEFTAQ